MSQKASIALIRHFDRARSASGEISETITFGLAEISRLRPPTAVFSRNDVSVAV